MHRTTDGDRGEIRNRKSGDESYPLLKEVSGCQRSHGAGTRIACRVDSSAVTRAMDWYPTFATFAGIKVPSSRVIDGRDLAPVLKGDQVRSCPGHEEIAQCGRSFQAFLEPGRGMERDHSSTRIQRCLFYHGSQGALSAVRWRNWKMYLNPSLELYDLSIDPGESKLVRNRDIVRKLRGMSVLFQQEMLADARPPGRVKVLDSTDGKHTCLNPPWMN